MSYILDALRCSEARREHRDQRLPDLFSVHVPPRRPDRRLWFAVGAAVVISNLSVLTIWSFDLLGPASLTETAAGSPARESDGVPAAGVPRSAGASPSEAIRSEAAPPAPAQPEGRGTPDPAPQPNGSASVAAGPGPREPAAGGIPLLAPPPPVRFDPPAPRAETPARIAVVAPRAGLTPVDPEPQPQRQPQPQPQPQPSRPGSLQAPPGPAAAEPVLEQPESDPALAVPGIEELAPATWAELPDILISMHSHVADPAARFARVNGRIVRQGEFVGETLQTVAITPAGVVFRHGEQEFFVARNANWRRPAAIGENR